MLSIALPAGKSLEQNTTILLDEARISLVRKDGSHSAFFPECEFLEKGTFVKPRRIPFLVQEGDFDVGIVGKDLVFESGAQVKVCAKLEFNRAGSGTAIGVLFADANDPVSRTKEVPSGSRVLSEYPNLTRRFFSQRAKSVEIIESPGSCEAEIPLKYRFGVALSETGKSLRANNLKVIGTIFESSTVLIANMRMLEDSKKRSAIKLLRLILRGVVDARDRFLVTMNVPSEKKLQIVSVLPALHSPTITGLQDRQFCSVSTVVKKSEVNLLLPRLLALGAQDILVTPTSAVIRSR